MTDDLPKPPRRVPTEPPRFPREKDEDEARCACCGGPVVKGGFFCSICVTAAPRMEGMNYSDEEKQAWVIRRRQEIENEREKNR